MDELTQSNAFFTPSPNLIDTTKSTPNIFAQTSQSSKKFFCGRNSKHNTYFFNINEELGPGGAQIFDPTSKSKTVSSEFVIKTAKRKQPDQFAVSLRNRGIDSSNGFDQTGNTVYSYEPTCELPKYHSPINERVNMNWRHRERAASPMGKGHTRMKVLQKNYHQKLFNLGKDEMKLFKKLIDVGIMPLREKHIDKKIYDQMTGRDPNSNIVLPKEKIENYQKLNLYIPSYLHRKFPDLKPFETASNFGPVIKRRTNLMSNPQIINCRGIANSIQFLKTKSTAMLHGVRTHNSVQLDASIEKNGLESQPDDLKNSLFKLTNLYSNDHSHVPKLPPHKLLIDGDTRREQSRKRSSIVMTNLLNNKPSFASDRGSRLGILANGSN